MARTTGFKKFSIYSEKTSGKTPARDKAKEPGRFVSTPEKNAAENSSLIVQVDKETADYLKIIRDSISDELRKVLETINPSAENSSYDLENEIKKLSNRIDDLTEMTEGLDNKLMQISKNLAELTELIKKNNI